ncbi:MAG TPA: hypothetical protein VHA37_07845, partial [Candidatus Saccharimonadales bacterium]|nr:hypothetical protein [Candidatus Saccharimonadales bacterium]
TFTSLHTSIGAQARSPLPTLILYAAMTVWVMRSRDPGVILVAWAPVAAMLALWNPHSMYPWYLSWGFVPLCCRWNRLHTLAVVSLGVITFFWQVIWYANVLP